MDGLDAVIAFSKFILVFSGASYFFRVYERLRLYCDLKEN